MKLEKEVKIGAITLLALIFGYICLNFLKGVDVFKQKCSYYVCFRNIGDVSTATPVKINGFKVGIVKEKELKFDQEEQVYISELKLSLDPEVRIKEGARVEIRSNMLTGTELIINMPKKRVAKFYADNDTIPVEESGRDLMDVAKQDIVPAIEEVLPKMSQTLDNLNGILSNKAIDTTLQNLQRSSKLMEQTLIRLNRSLAPMPKVMANLAETSESLTVVGKQAEQIKLEELVNNLTETSATLKALTNDINSSKGSLGLLIKDKELYHRVDSLANSADALLKDIRLHPKRYVKLSLF